MHAALLLTRPWAGFPTANQTSYNRPAPMSKVEGARKYVCLFARAMPRLFVTCCYAPHQLTRRPVYPVMMQRMASR